jgi:hypothetical protein
VVGLVLAVALALSAIEVGLWVGYRLSGLSHYAKHYKNGYSQGYDRSVRPPAGTSDDSQGTWVCNGVTLDPREARREIQLRTYDLGSYGDIRVKTGWCILKIAAVPDSGADDHAAGHVPGCARIEECCQMSYSREYTAMNDGIWGR